MTRISKKDEDEGEASSTTWDPCGKEKVFVSEGSPVKNLYKSTQLHIRYL